MANFEEKILGYFDGSLSEAEREEVLAAISGEHAQSHERALFDAHLRLQDLYSVARKPVSAPLSVQRDLAQQLPVLALKLPYLAAPDRRNRISAGWLGAVRSSWVNVFILLAGLTLIGGIWYAVRNNTNPDTSMAAMNAVTSPSANSGATGSMPAAVNGSALNSPLSEAAGGTLASANPRATNTDGLNSNTPHSLVPGDNASNAGSSKVTNFGRATSMHSNSGNSSVSSNSSSDRNIRASAKARTLAMNENPPQRSIVANTMNPTPSNATQGNAEYPPDENDQREMLPPPIHSIAIPPTQPVIFQSHRTPSISFLDSEDESNFVPLRVYASSGERYVITKSSLSSYVTGSSKGITGNSWVPSYEAGLDYELTPWTAIGVHAGLTSFSQYQPFTHSANSFAFSSQYLDDYVSSSSSAWCALAITQTFNPSDRARFALSIAGGPAFTQPLAWLGMVEATTSYDLSRTLLVRLGVSFDMEQVKQAAQVPNSILSSTEGYVIESNGGTLLSNALGISLGLSFHP